MYTSKNRVFCMIILIVKNKNNNDLLSVSKELIGPSMERSRGGRTRDIRQQGSFGLISITARVEVRNKQTEKKKRVYSYI